MSEFKKYLPTKIIAELKSDEDFSKYQMALDDFDVDDLQSLQSNFLFLNEELEEDYETFCENLHTHFGVIEELLHNEMDNTTEQKRKSEIFAIKGMYEDMWNYVADEKRKFIFYKESISKSILINNKNSTEDTESNGINSYSDTIRLLHETGIIDHLEKKYTNTSTNSIAKFFELITKKPLLASSTNTLFTTDKSNVKYLMKNLSHTKKQHIKNKLEEFKFY